MRDGAGDDDELAERDAAVDDPARARPGTPSTASVVDDVHSSSTVTSKSLGVAERRRARTPAAGRPCRRRRPARGPPERQRRASMTTIGLPSTSASTWPVVEDRADRSAARSACRRPASASGVAAPWPTVPSNDSVRLRSRRSTGAELDLASSAAASGRSPASGSSAVAPATTNPASPTAPSGHGHRAAGEPAPHGSWLPPTRTAGPPGPPHSSAACWNSSSANGSSRGTAVAASPPRHRHHHPRRRR